MLRRARTQALLALVAALALVHPLLTVAGAAVPGTGSPQTLQDGSLLFPNETRWGGKERDGMGALAAIIAQSHTMAMLQMQQLRNTQERESSPRVQQLALAYRRNLQTARMAYSVLRDYAKGRDGEETTLTFEAGRSLLTEDSRAMRRLESFAKRCRRETKERDVVILALGSTAPQGAEAVRPGLAATRASFAKRRLQSMLSSTASVIHEIAGFGGMYGSVDNDRSLPEAYQYVRLTAVYDDPVAETMVWSRPSPSADTTPAITSPEPGMPTPAQPAPYYSQPAAGRPTGGAVVAGGSDATQPLYPPSTPVRRQPTGYTDPFMTMGGMDPVRENDLGMRLVYIPPGTFLMGSPEEEMGRDRDERIHEVTLSKGFYMQNTEVTQQQWMQVMGGNPSHFENCGMDCPVESVTWHQAQAFVNKLNTMHSTKRYRLPSEAEWEYACRAGSREAFYRGEMVKGECGYNEMLSAVGWYHGNSENGTHPVAQKEPNAWGLYDMHGNVWEWCGDREGKYAFTPKQDPAGPSTGMARVRRGGSWSDYPMFCRAANRSWHNPNDAAAKLGFRIAMDVNEPEEAAKAEEKVEAPAPTPVINDCEITTRQGENLHVRRGIPDAREGAGAVSVERSAPTQVKVGEATRYRLILRNLTDCEIILVTLTEHPDPNFHVSDTKPKAERLSDGALRWQVKPLEPGGKREFVIMGTARADGTLDYCTTADYRLKVCSTLQAVSPKLTLGADSPANVMTCEDIPITLTVANPGSGEAENVSVDVQLADGLVFEDGKQRVTLSAGRLGIKQSRDFTLSARALRTGSFSVSAAASAANGLRATASTSTSVSAPSLSLTKSGPAIRYAGRPAQYTLRVTNNGNAPAENTQVRDAVPAGMDILDLSEGGAESDSGALWSLGTLAPGASKRLSIRLVAGEPGTYTNTATARATCAENVQATAKTRVAGVAAILLEVADENDPLEVGGTGTYIIVATNQGSAPCTNLKVICALEENLRYVSSSGATRGHLQNGGVHFETLDVLPAKQKATWHVRVKAVEAGDVRFRTILNTDQLNRPVEETEATTLY